MPRKARLNVPGAVYHVMGRCLDHLALFVDDDDHERFLSVLGLYLERTATRCYGWAFMRNHYHLVIRLGNRELWELMKPLNMHYAQFHRNKYGRRGPLFMDRFKSIATQDQNYVQELVRYVHLNPVRAGICKSLEALDKYPWSGHSALMGLKNRNFQDTGTVLKRFGRTVSDAREKYRKFLSEGMESDDQSDMLVALVRKSNSGSEGGRSANCWVIGDPEFVKNAVASVEANRLRISRFEREGGSLGTIADKICRKFGITPELLKERHRGGAASDARKAFAYVAAKEFRASLGVVADYLGVGRTAVSAMSRDGRGIAESKKVVI
jgi:REP element-mobilizing transposase RayT